MPIRKAVGLPGKSLGNKNTVANGVEDVRIIQCLLNQAAGKLASKKFPPFSQPLAIPETGHCDAQTVAAIVAFQRYAMRDPRPSGVVAPDDATLRLLYAVANDFKFSGLPPEPASAGKMTNPLHKPNENKTYILPSHVNLSVEDRLILEDVANEYFKQTGEPLQVNSGTRTAHGQADAMFRNIRKKGIESLRRLYVNKKALEEILDAYQHGRKAKKSDNAIIADMTRVIESQMKSKIFISDHLVGRAIDLSSSLSPAKRAILKKIVSTRENLQLLNEVDHLHIEINR